MVEQKNIVIPLDEKSESVLQQIIKKHGLLEGEEEVFAKVKEHKLFNENVVIQLTRDLMTEKLPNKDFLDSLQKELGISKEQTKNLAISIADELIPILKKYTEDDIKNYREEKESSEELSTNDLSTVQELMLKKISKKTQEKDSSLAQRIEGMPDSTKKLEINNVEENAKKMKGNPQEPKMVPEKKEESQPQPQNGPDSYRETIE